MSEFYRTRRVLFSILLPLVALLIFTGLLYAAAGDISTLDTPGFTLNNPRSVILDNDGNIYISDQWNHRIIKVDTNGVASVFAGTGNYGFSGDGGPATSAQFFGPSYMAFDADGNLYVADRYNNRVRQINTSGVITTVVGTGAGETSGNGGLATEAGTYWPVGVVFDHDGNMYVAQYQNHVVRKIDTSGVITTFAGNGTWGYEGDGGLATEAQLKNPAGLAVDCDNNIYIGDSNAASMRVVLSASGIITRVAGGVARGYGGDGGPAHDAQLFDPYQAAIDGNGDIYISDSVNERIRKVDMSTGIITTVVGTGSAGYSGDGGPALEARMDAQEGIVFDSAGNLYIADTDNNVIRIVEGLGAPVSNRCMEISAGGSIDEGAGTATVTLSFIASSIPLTLSYQTADLATQTLAPTTTATAGEDYIAQSGTIVVGPSETEKVIEITIVEDVLYEANEQFHVNIYDPNNGNALVEQVTFTILDDDYGVMFPFVAR